ncbi:karyopherin [Sporothrix epigloea]|uniref:Karyopherin n=1 Tax=Sporothrix epigloea TaxID=1892477 RepID=A0ABP0DDA3_9PEZI
MVDHFANNGSGSSATNDAVNESDEVLLAKVTSALELIYNPQSTNKDRQEAQNYLEIVKEAVQAPSVGFTLAINTTNSSVVRHFGLSLLEHSIKHKWASYSTEQASWIRQWLLELAQSVTRAEPSFLRNKIALLWVEVAKRCWAGDWMEMDAQLLSLWQSTRSGHSCHKELVLCILETLSDEVFNGDDAVVALREGVLSKSCVDIFTPASVLNECFPNRVTAPNVRAGSEGWLLRVTELLSDCMSANVQSNDDARTCAIRALAVQTSLLPWAIPKAVVACHCVPILCESLGAPHVAVQKAALEALHAFYSRNHFTEEEFVALVIPVYDSKYVELYHRLFEWSKVDVNDIDDDKYQFAKKFSEMLSCLGNYLDRRFHNLPAGVDVQRFVEFLLEVVRSESLVVSIPVLVTWTRLLAHRNIGPLIANTALIGPLLEVCSSRLIRYENLPEDSQDTSYLFLLEDTDTIPERHAFLGNYRRYSSQVIEAVVQLKLVDAFRHILSQAESVLHHLYDDGQQFTVTNYNKNSMPVLRVDAHFTVVDAALKGFMKWRASTASSDGLAEKQQQRAVLEAEFEAWCNRLADLQFEDPCIRKRVLQLLVAFSITALDCYPSFMLKVLEHILMTWPNLSEPEHRAYNDAIKELQSESMVELQRLAIKQPDHLLSVYDQLHAKIKELIASGTLDEKRQVAYQSVLFLIIHRTSQIDQGARVQRLREFLDPVKAQWGLPGLEQSLSSFSSYTEMVGLDKAQLYIARHQIDKIGDWGSIELDAEGLELQADLEARQVLLPLRSTKIFLNASVERLDNQSESFKASLLLWQDAVPLILTRLLKFLDYGHASHNHSNWTLLPEEMRPSVGRLLTDRFWQSGISEGSKDDFYARVLDRKGTMEGLASSIRSTVRYVRETAYSVLCSLSRFSVQFYSFSELPEPLSKSLFENALHLPPHQLIGLLNLVRFLVDSCPVEFREQFLPPLIASCFQQTSSKLAQEWGRIDQQQEVKTDVDGLTEEMKVESILRQFGYCAVIMMADFLDPARANVLLQDETPQQVPAVATEYPTLRRFCLMQTSLVEPLMIFCNHVVRIHDGRCCSIVLRVLRTVIGEFVLADPVPSGPPALPNAPASGNDEDASTHRVRSHSATAARPPDPFPISAETSAAVREYLSSEVLKSCIMSLHEPYFVDQQKELASLIASILCHYCPITPTPREVLLSLPNIKSEDVDFVITQICNTGMQMRQQRALVLDLLKELKGVSVAEMGKLNRTGGLKRDSFRPSSKRASNRSKMAQEFMTAPPSAANGMGSSTHAAAPNNNRQASPDLEGIAGLFNLAE